MQLFFILNSAEHKFILVINVKMPKFSGGIIAFISMILRNNCDDLSLRISGVLAILIFMSNLKFMLSCVEY